MAREVPFEITDVESELNTQLLADFTGERTSFLQVGPKKYFFPSQYRTEASKFYNFKFRSDDVLISTYPRSGTTVMQEMLWLLIHDLDYTAAAATSVMFRAPFLEFGILVHPGLREEVIARTRSEQPAKLATAQGFGLGILEALEQAPSPRLIKTHLPFSLLSPDLLDTCKVVHMARNPKDVAVSYYHHNRLLRTQGYVGDFPRYWDYFERNLLPSSPYWEYLREAWQRRDHPNMLFLFYEDLVKDMRSTIRQVAQFLGKEVDEAQVTRLAEHLHIDNFRKNPATNLEEQNLPGLRVAGEQSFIRTGQTGSWRAEFTPDLEARADTWIAENIRTIPDFAFPA